MVEPKTIQHNAQRLGKVLTSRLYGKVCEKCHYGLRHKNRNWCKRCIDVYRRASASEAAIIEQVGLLYAGAEMSHLEGDVAEKLGNLNFGQDVFMFGDIGVGKTYAMAALIRVYMQEGFLCKRINFDDFCVEVRSTMSPGSKTTEWEMTNFYKDADKLFIDDLGIRSKMETDFAYVTFFSILNKRQEQMLPTFITTNKSIRQLSKSFDERIASRLSTALIIQMTGKDRRK